ncbi:MAG: hypothetical protein RL139_86 [Gemmatimonadota bacterium]
MRAVTSATAATVLGIRPKQLDNVLARIGAGAFPVGRQGRDRRLPIQRLPELALTLELVTRLGVPVRKAHRVAAAILQGDLDAGPVLQLAVDLAHLRRRIDERLALAIESVVRLPRGRPTQAQPRRTRRDDR